MKIESWAFRHLDQDELLEHLISLNRLSLDKSGKDAVRSLLSSFCRRRGFGTKMHELKWATTNQIDSTYLQYHHSRIFSRYPRYNVQYHRFDEPPESPDWILIEWISGTGSSQVATRRLNICIRPSGANDIVASDKRRLNKNEDA